MDKKVAILFSGGLDSTYLVWKNLTDGNEVYPIYIEIENNDKKTMLEKNRIKLLWKEFNNEFHYNKPLNKSLLHDIQYVLKVSVSSNEDSLYFKQIPIWMFAMAFLQSLSIDEIQIGYVANDDAISYLDDIRKIYWSYQTICEQMKKLTFPLSKIRKIEMAAELPKKYLELIYSCENPRIIGSVDAEKIEYEPCCGCASCKHIIASNYYGLGDFPEIYKKGIQKQHAVALWGQGFRVLDKEGNDFQYIEKMNYRKQPYQLELYIDGGYYDNIEKENSEHKEKASYNG